MPRVASRIAPVLCLLSLGLLAGCQSFGYRWDTEAAQPANPSAMLDGKWEGTWQSDATDYSGHAQAIVVHSTHTVADGQYVQQYAVSFRLFYQEIPFRDFTLTVNASMLADGRLHFEGKKDLGYFFGGIVKYDGFVYPNKDEMYCDYATEKDAGTYKLRHVLPELQ